MDPMKNYYEQLVGATITDYQLIEDEYALDPFPCFSLKAKDGSTIRVEVSRDQEGNGGGFLFISQKEETK